jgi:hypothetical protein
MTVEYLEEADLVARPLRVAAAPVHSLLMALRDAAGAERAGTPEAWRRVIRAHLTRRDYDVLAPLSTSRPAIVPSALVPFPEPGVQTLKDGLEQLVAAEDALGGEIEECMGAGGAGDWRDAAGDPHRWILHTVPSAATHHVSALVAAGLVMRDRSNGSLLVRRTGRGDALVALYDPA